jgi:hypothetical protein
MLAAHHGSLEMALRQPPLNAVGATRHQAGSDHRRSPQGRHSVLSGVTPALDIIREVPIATRCAEDENGQGKNEFGGSGFH